jgi:hypothetical protein
MLNPPSKILLSLFLFGFALLLGACEGEKPGDRCDGFFANGCKGDMTCFDTGSQKVCAKSCDYGGTCENKAGCCAAGFECHNTTAVGAGMPPGGAMMGGYCFKK